MLTVARQKQVEGLEVFAVDEEAIGGGVEVGEGGEEAGFESRGEEGGVEHEVRVAVQIGSGSDGHTVEGVPFGELAGIGHNLGIEFGATVGGEFVEGEAVVALQDEFALEEEAALVAFELVEEGDDLLADGAGGLETGGGTPGVQGIGEVDVFEVQDFGFEEVVEFAAQEAAKVLVNEEVAGVFGGVAVEVVGQAACVALFLRVGFGQARAQRGVGEGGQDGGVGGVEELGLLVAAGDGGAFGLGERAVFHRDDEGGRGLIPGDGLVGGVDEVAVVAFDVVAGDVDFGEAHVDGGFVGQALGGGKGEAVVVEVDAGLDVVLVEVGPMEVHFLAVVGDGVFVGAAVAALGDEVAVLVVAGEEGVEVVVDGGFGVLGDEGVVEHRLGGEVGFAKGGIGEVVRQGVAVEGIGTEHSDQVLAGFGKGGLGLGVGLGGDVGQAGGDGVEEVVLDEAGDLGAFLVHHGIEAEVEVGAVELEEFVEEGLEFSTVCVCVGHCPSELC